MLTHSRSRVRTHRVIVSAQSIAHTVLEDCLSISELKVGCTIVSTKKENWLLGRFAAKVAIADALAYDFGTDFPYTEIEIISRTLQPPTFRLQGDSAKRVGELPEYYLSIAHSHGLAVGEVMPQENCAGIGVDVERIRAFNEHTLRHFCTEREYEEHLRISAIRDREEDATLRWCLKEAYLKALGTGLCTHPRMIEVRRGVGSPNVTLYHNNKEIPAHIYWTTRNDDYIIVSASI